MRERPSAPAEAHSGELDLSTVSPAALSPPNPSAGSGTPCQGRATRTDPVPPVRSSTDGLVRVRIPAVLVEKWCHETAWLAELPSLVLDCAALWRLELEQPIETPNSLIVPARTAVLKLNAPSHREADHEADALACWSGRGAVRLLARDAARRALLCERCLPGTRLWDTANVDEAAVVAELLTTLCLVPQPPHPFRLLADEAERWDAELRVRYRQCGQPFERSLLEFATDVCRSADRAAGFLVNEDLHGGNILKATRSSWLLIDPKPLVG